MGGSAKAFMLLFPKRRSRYTEMQIEKRRKPGSRLHVQSKPSHPWPSNQRTGASLSKREISNPGTLPLICPLKTAAVCLLLSESGQSVLLDSPGVFALNRPLNSGVRWKARRGRFGVCIAVLIFDFSPNIPFVRDACIAFRIV